MEYGNPSDYNWDVLTGVSIGGINSSAMSLFAIGNEQAAVDFIWNTWVDIQTSDIYKERPLGMLAGLDHVSIYDTSPGMAYLKEHLAPQSEYKRKLTLSAVDIENGSIVNMTDENTPVDQLYLSVLASASVPGAFPPTLVNGRLLIDGMTAYNTNIQVAIDRCRELVGQDADDSKITIDVMICEKPSSIEQWDKIGNSWSQFFRSRSIGNSYHGSDAIAGVQRAHPNINWRHTVYQSVKATGFDEIDFSNKVTDPLQAAGKVDGKAAVDALNDVTNQGEVNPRARII